jgi:uncharacterized membrane protein YfcA
MLTSLVLYLALGVIAGLIAGLLGVGGGLVIVPIVVFSLNNAGVEQEVMHLALGTSFATIVFTSISSLLAHNRRGAVLWPVVRSFSPGIVLGVIIGALLVAQLRSVYLQVIFVCFLFYTANKMIRGKKAESGRALPGKAGLFGAGGVIGFVSSLVGIGGGSLTVPFLTWCNIQIHQAVGTSAAVGLPIAVTGAVMYIFTGWGNPQLPEHSLGYVYLPALLGIAMASVCTAPLGTALSHRLPVGVLRKCFAVLLLLTGVRMLWLVLKPLFQ